MIPSGQSQLKSAPLLPMKVICLVTHRINLFHNRRHSVNFGWTQHHTILFPGSKVPASRPHQGGVLRDCTHSTDTTACQNETSQEFLFVWGGLELNQTSKPLDFKLTNMFGFGFFFFFFKLPNIFVIGLTLILFSWPSLQNNLTPTS